uniref:Ribosomal protein S6 kinase delta n=1 Tax=Euwallacea interjectus TaxID=321055 RepID=A0AB74UL61_9CUCU
MMTSNSWTSWVRTFDIPDASKHKNGFTIYKVVSFLYPESCPDAVTKLIVWKRFNDFKKLHKDIKALHKKFKLQGEIPNLPKSVLFKRYDEETINQRKRGILNFLDYIGSHAELFTSSECVKFFETSHTPVEMLTSNINSIRANLCLPSESQLYNNSDLSDTDSFDSSNFEASAQTLKTNLKKLNSMTSIDSQASESISIANVDNNLLLFKDSSSPEAFSEVTQYLKNASLHVHLAIDLENEKQFEEAFSAYKTAVDILINGGKDDPDYDRRQMVRYKTNKYLIRAERIYNMYLAPEIRDLHLHRGEEKDKPNIIKGPLYNLYKYKVIKIISQNGMLVLHSEQQKIYYVKVIHKSVQFSNSALLALPQNVPYMVKLVSHYNSDNAIFLVLEYCNGSKLRDIIDNKTSLLDKDEQLLRNIQDQSDDDSEMSFSELLNSYAANKQDGAESDDGSFEKVEVDVTRNLMDRPLDFLAAPDLLPQQTPEECAASMSSEVRSSIDLGEEIEVKNNISEGQIVKWASQLVVALDKLHSQGVICRNLKVGDVMIDLQDNLVLTYMSNLKEFCELYSREIDFDLAPEVYGLELVGEEADWWSFGAILYELLVGMSISKVHVNGLRSHTHLIIPQYVPIEGKSLLKQLLIYEPQERLGSRTNGVQHIKSHPFFRRINWSRVESTC